MKTLKTMRFETPVTVTVRNFNKWSNGAVTYDVKTRKHIEFLQLVRDARGVLALILENEGRYIYMRPFEVSVNGCKVWEDNNIVNMPMILFDEYVSEVE